MNKLIWMQYTFILIMIFQGVFFVKNIFSMLEKAFVCLLFFLSCVSQIAVYAADITCNDIYSVDCVFSIGAKCRPAYYIQKYNMRFQAAPLDWMMNYSLETAIHLFETKFCDFFEEIEEIPNKSRKNCKVIKDTKNGIISIHHFNKNSPLQVEHEKFREMMLNRASKVDEILNQADSIGLICDRSDVTTVQLIEFAKKFSKIYPNKEIILINVVDVDTEVIHKSVLFKDDKLTIIQFVFSDKQPIEEANKFPKWTGNQMAWKSVTNNLKIKSKQTDFNTN